MIVLRVGSIESLDSSHSVSIRCVDSLDGGDNYERWDLYNTVMKFML